MIAHLEHGVPTSPPGHTTGSGRVVRYLSWFAVGFLFFIVVSAAMLIETRARIGDCDGSGYGGDWYLAWCGSANFQDYEHGAFYMELEPAAVANVRNAEVIFLGSSLAQAALSSDALAAYFRDRGQVHYLLGFGHGETSRFPMELIRDLDLRPSIAVANVADFFAEDLSGVASGIVYADILRYVEYSAKKWLQPVQRNACAGQGTFAGFLCGDAPTIYRSRADGRWRLLNFPNEKKPVIASATPAPAAKLAKQIAVARSMQAELAARGTCLVLTATPSEDGRHVAEARSIAAALGAPSVFPSAAGLTAFDGSHLDTASAEIFSARLIAEWPRLEAACANDLKRGNP